MSWATVPGEHGGVLAAALAAAPARTLTLNLAVVIVHGVAVDQEQDAEVQFKLSRGRNSTEVSWRELKDPPGGYARWVGAGNFQVLDGGNARIFRIEGTDWYTLMLPHVGNRYIALTGAQRDQFHAALEEFRDYFLTGQAAQDRRAVDKKRRGQVVQFTPLRVWGLQYGDPRTLPWNRDSDPPMLHVAVKPTTARDEVYFEVIDRFSPNTPRAAFKKTRAELLYMATESERRLGGEYGWWGDPAFNGSAARGALTTDERERVYVRLHGQGLARMIDVEGVRFRQGLYTTFKDLQRLMAELEAHQNKNPIPANLRFPLLVEVFQFYPQGGKEYVVTRTDVVELHYVGKRARVPSFEFRGSPSTRTRDLRFQASTSRQVQTSSPKLRVFDRFTLPVLQAGSMHSASNSHAQNEISLADAHALQAAKLWPVVAVDAWSRWFMGERERHRALVAFDALLERGLE